MFKTKNTIFLKCENIIPKNILFQLKSKTNTYSRYSSSYCPVKLY